MKKFFIIIISLLIIGGGLYFWRTNYLDRHTYLNSIKRAHAEWGTIAVKIPAPGHVVPYLEVDIKCKASGEVIRLPYDVSDVVKKRELLVELDPNDERRFVKQAEATLTASQARLSQAKLNLQITEKNLKIEKNLAEAALKSALANAEYTNTKHERKKQLFEKKLISEEEFDAAKTQAIQAASELERAKIHIEELKVKQISLQLKAEDVRLAEAQVESDKLSLSIAKQRLKDTKVFAPIDGVVSARGVQIGQIISSGITSISGGTTVMTISDLSHIFVLASVDESDIGNVKIGQKAEIRVDAYEDRKFMGEVIRIATKGDNVSNIVTFQVKLEVLGDNRYLLKPEMSADVSIIAVEVDRALLIPYESVIYKDEKAFVKIDKKEAEFEEHEIEVGINDGEQIQIINGLAEGDTVVLETVKKVESRWRKKS